jgi:HEAT repeat protein
MLAPVRLLRGRPPRVEKLERKGDVDGLVRALAYEDPITDSGGRFVDLGLEVRKSAAEALGRMESHAAFDGLLRALDDPEDAVRVTAVRGLRERGDPLAAEQLTSAVTTWTQPEHARAREEALDALAFLRDPTAPRRVAAGLITRATELDDADDANILRRLTHAGGHDAMRGTIDDLIARLGEDGPGQRVRRMLVWLAPESVDPLMAALDDDAARRDAILALGGTHDSRAVEPLSTILLTGDDPSTRTAAAWALGEIRDPAAVEPLLMATGDSDYGVRSEAIVNFDKLGNAAIAVAMSALVRPVLEESSAPATEAIAAPDGGPDQPAAEDDTPPEEPSAPAPDIAPTRVRQRPSELARLSQSSPVLRRLGRRLGL